MGGGHETEGKWWTNGIFNETTAINDKKVIRGEFLAGGEPPVELWSLEAKAGNLGVLGAPVEAAPVSYSQTSHQRGRHCCQFFSPSFSRQLFQSLSWERVLIFWQLLRLGTITVTSLFISYLFSFSTFEHTFVQNNPEMTLLIFSFFFKKEREIIFPLSVVGKWERSFWRRWKMTMNK